MNKPAFVFDGRRLLVDDEDRVQGWFYRWFFVAFEWWAE